MALSVLPSRIQSKSKIYIKRTIYNATSNRKKELKENQQTSENYK